MANFVVMQVREYRLHKMEVVDHGKAGFTVTIVPPANRGGVPREVTRDGTTVTMADCLNRAKAEIDAVMGPKPAFKPRAYGR